ncbi:hypothetical protein L916_03374, partial [Phytophthora nicotianae]
ILVHRLSQLQKGRTSWSRRTIRPSQIKLTGIFDISEYPNVSSWMTIMKKPLHNDETHTSFWQQTKTRFYPVS